MPITYKEVLEKLKDSPVPLESVQAEQVRTGLKMKAHFHPWSITEVEFNTLYNKIIERKLIYGFEVATAFGISALAAGLAFKETGGRLITMDAYIEEYYNYCGGYKEKKETYENMDGWKSIVHIIQVFELEDVITPVVGWSPDDIEKHIHGKLDYAFIDGGHWKEQVIKDTREIQRHLSMDKFNVFFHDGQGIDFRNELSGILGTEIYDVCGMPDCWNLLGAQK